MFEFELPTGQLLRTVISHGKDEYGAPLRAKVLAQLAVDDATFREVLRSGEPPPRPSPVEERIELVPLEFINRVSRCLEPGDLEGATPDEYGHLARWLWSRPDVGCAAERPMLLAELENFRTGLEGD